MHLKSLWRKVNAQKSSTGNALMEYALPASVILLSTGLLITLTGSVDLMASYFLSASGRTTGSLSGTTFRTQGLAENATGDNGLGLEGFNAASFGSVSGADSAKGERRFYSNTVARSGARQGSGSREYLYGQ